jgi:hypothetical protein
MLAAMPSCDSMVGRDWLIHALRGSSGALGGRRKRSGRVPSWTDCGVCRPIPEWRCRVL